MPVAQKPGICTAPANPDSPGESSGWAGKSLRDGYPPLSADFPVGLTRIVVAGGVILTIVEVVIPTPARIAPNGPDTTILPTGSDLLMEIPASRQDSCQTPWQIPASFQGGKKQMKSNWTRGLVAVAISALASGAVAQQGWDQPSTLGNYQPASHARYPGVYQDEGPAAVPPGGQGADPNHRSSPSDTATRAPAQGYGVYNPGVQSSPPLYQDGCNGCGPAMPGSMVYGNSMPAGNYGPGCNGAGGGYGVFGNAMPGTGADGYGPAVGNSYLNGPAYQSGACQGGAGYGQGPVYGDGSGAGYNPAGYAQNQNVTGYGYSNGYGACDSGYGPWQRNAGSGGYISNRAKSANWIGGASALIFRRDYEDDRGLSFNGAGQYLFSTDSDMDTMGGVEAMLGRRGCNGLGWEARYWGLYPTASNFLFGGTPYTALGGMSDVFHVPTGASVLDIYNRADTHQVIRENSFTNVEINMLRNAGSSGQATYEFFGGARWLQFNEHLCYNALSTYPGDPMTFTYANRVENQMLGFQLGGRSERCLSGRFGLSGGFSCGLFNNRISHQTRMYDNDTDTDALIYSGPFNGRPYNYGSNKNDIAMLGELNLGGYFLIRNNLRISLGYRAIGVSGVALAADQIPYNFTDGNDIQRIDSNGSLILHGAYVGLQSCF